MIVKIKLQTNQGRVITVTKDNNDARVKGHPVDLEKYRGDIEAAKAIVKGAAKND